MKRNLTLLCLFLFVTITCSFAQSPNPRLEVNQNNIKTPTIMDLVARINKLEEENTKLKKQLDEVTTNYTTLSNTVADVKKENGFQKYSIKGLESTLTTLKTDIGTLQTSFNTHYHKIKGGFSSGSADDYTMHLVRSSKTLHDDVETFKTTGGPLQ